MRTEHEIRDLAKYLKDDYYDKRIEEQQTDQTYYDDTFKVPWVVDTGLIRRTGSGFSLVNSPVERAITANPIAYRDFKFGKDEHSANKVAKEYNRWVQVLKKQQFFKGHLKTNLLRGEAWIQMVHNDVFLPPPIGEDKKSSVPVHFLLPDPIIVFGSEEEDEDGRPEFVIMEYERSAWQLAKLYPKWGGKNSDLETLKKKETFLYYIDKDQEFAAIGTKEVKNQANIFGFVPWVHKYTGFGSYSPNTPPEEKAVGRLRFSRHTMERETSLITDIDNAIHLYSNRSIDAQITDKDVDTKAVVKHMKTNYEIGAGLVHITPYGVEIKRAVEMLPDQATYQYLGAVKADMAREDPLAMSEMPLGSSGRQDDIVEGWSFKRYAPMVENCQEATNTAFGMALRMCEKTPGLMPEGITKEDIHGDYSCRIELKAADPTDKSAKIIMGSKLRGNGDISFMEFQTVYLGKSQEEAKMAQAEILADRIQESMPVSDLYASIFKEEADLEEYMAKMKANPTQGVDPMGEVQTERGMGETNLNLEQRPQRYPPNG